MPEYDEPKRSRVLRELRKQQFEDESQVRQARIEQLRKLEDELQRQIIELDRRMEAQFAAASRDDFFTIVSEFGVLNQQLGQVRSDLYVLEHPELSSTFSDLKRS
jgi:hypothetical protein